MSKEYESLIGTFEQKKSLVAQFNLIDDTFFSVVMRDKGACEYLLEKILGRPFHVIENKTQYSIRNIEEHSVILDPYAEDSDHKIYNIEVHTGDTDNLKKRVRYYQSALNWSLLEKSKDYEKLPDTYIIYITQNDFLGLGRNNYEIVKHIKDSDVLYDNGEYLLFLNTEINDGTDLSDFLQYIKKTDADNDKFGELSKAVKYHKSNEQGVRFMCEIVERIAKEQRAAGLKEGLLEGEVKGRMEGVMEGIVRGKLEMIRNMLSRGTDLSEALAIAGIDRKTYEEFSKIN